MITVQIRDDVIWAKDLQADSRLFETVKEMEQNAPITLVVDGRPVIFRKMRDGKDGRRTPGLRPDTAFKDFWRSLQTRRGEVIKVGALADHRVEDPYLAAISQFLDEWNTPEDAAAYDDL